MPSSGKYIVFIFRLQAYVKLGRDFTHELKYMKGLENLSFRSAKWGFKGPQKDVVAREKVEKILWFVIYPCLKDSDSTAVKGMQIWKSGNFWPVYM